MQSLVIANALPEAQITAIDLQAEYLDQLRLSAAARGLIHRLEIQRQDMAALPYPPQSFDLLWAEGSAYSIGFADALRAWRPLLRPGGYLGVSELVWLTANPEPKVQAFFASEYPAMGDLSAAQTALRDAGYSLIGSFVLPDPDWWDDYYGPLAAKLPALRKRYANDPAGLDVVEATAREIDMRTRYSHAYGYGFLVGRA